MKSVMQHQFSQVPRADIPRSSFKRDHGYKTTFDVGNIVPFFVDECLPGDTYNVKATILARLNTPIVPIMDNMVLDTFFFAVPLRLLWDNFQKFMGEQTNPGDSTDYAVPLININEDEHSFAHSLEDYFGLADPSEGASGQYDVCAFYHRAYALIYNEWFRDQNLQNTIPVSTGDGPDDCDEYVIRKRGKRHDYFTSALPWPQKGPGVELPLGETAPVVFNPTYPNFGTTLYDADDGSALATSSNINTLVSTGITFMREQTGGQLMTLDNADQLEVDLTNATAATINSLREAFQLQRLYERDARGGTRYTEIVRSHFGTVSPDSRLQRPEYLGGSSAPVNITAVPQTSSTDATTPQGNLSGFGTVNGRGGFVKSFTEHCVIIGLCNVRADLTYQQGINRMFSRRTRFDYYWPALAHLGEQEILNKEIYFSGNSADTEVFGYQERWAEYRYKPSQITGKLRSTDAQSLDVWHLSEEFASKPTLSLTFIQDNTPLDRCVAVPSEPHFTMDSYIQMKCARPMPVYSVPGKIDHF